MHVRPKTVTYSQLARNYADALGSRHRSPTYLKRLSMTRVRIVFQWVSSAHSEGNDAKEIHSEPGIVDVMGVIANQVEVSRGAKAEDGPEKKDS